MDPGWYYIGYEIDEIEQLDEKQTGEICCSLTYQAEEKS